MSEEDRLKTEIEHTREDLSQSVQALTHKVDVPARVRQRGAELGEQARRVPASRWLAAGGVAAVVALVLLLVRTVRA